MLAGGTLKFNYVRAIVVVSTARDLREICIVKAKRVRVMSTGHNPFQIPHANLCFA